MVNDMHTRRGSIYIVTIIIEQNNCLSFL